MEHRTLSTSGLRVAARGLRIGDMKAIPPPWPPDGAPLRIESAPKP